MQSLVAGFGPARRAARISPGVALRMVEGLASRCEWIEVAASLCEWIERSQRRSASRLNELVNCPHRRADSPMSQSLPVISISRVYSRSRVVAERRQSVLKT